MTNQYFYEGSQVDWQPTVGKISEKLRRKVDDVDQCLKIILGTPKGSDPFRPEFGSDLYKLVDVPVNIAYPQIVAETVTAISVWEKRIKIENISRSLNETGDKITIQIKWTLKDEEVQQTTEVAI